MTPCKIKKNKNKKPPKFFHVLCLSFDRGCITILTKIRLRSDCQH